jgi:hypothetical protein
MRFPLFFMCVKLGINIRHFDVRFFTIIVNRLDY